jgi:hypothetical protein
MNVPIIKWLMSTLWCAGAIAAHHRHNQHSTMLMNVLERLQCEEAHRWSACKTWIPNLAKKMWSTWMSKSIKVESY